MVGSSRNCLNLAHHIRNSKFIWKVGLAMEGVGCQLGSISSFASGHSNSDYQIFPGDMNDIRFLKIRDFWMTQIIIAQRVQDCLNRGTIASKDHLVRPLFVLFNLD